MTTAETKFDFEQLILRLERNHQCVLRLSRNLNSYKYEPRNYDCFTRLRELKSSFAALAKKQMALFDKIQSQSLSFDKAVQNVNSSIQDFHNLEKQMAAYLLDL